MAIEFKQDFLQGYCKMCGRERRFVTHINDPEKMVCCFCFYQTTKKANKKLTIIPHYTYYGKTH